MYTGLRTRGHSILSLRAQQCMVCSVMERVTRRGSGDRAGALHALDEPGGAHPTFPFETADWRTASYESVPAGGFFLFSAAVYTSVAEKPRTAGTHTTHGRDLSTYPFRLAVDIINIARLFLCVLLYFLKNNPPTTLLPPFFLGSPLAGTRG